MSRQELVWDEAQRMWCLHKPSSRVSRCVHGWLPLLFGPGIENCTCGKPPSGVAGWYYCDCESHQRLIKLKVWCERKPVTEEQIFVALALAKLQAVT